MRKTINSQMKINLKKLEEISNNDKAFIQFICKLFIKETINTEERFRQLIEQKKYKEIKYLLHQCKPRFALIDDQHTTTLINEIEIQLNQKRKYPIIQELGAQLLIRFRISRKEIKMQLNKKLKNTKNLI
jgi:hypothetical protein